MSSDLPHRAKHEVAPDPGLSDTGFQLTSSPVAFPAQPPASLMSLCLALGLCSGCARMYVVGGWPEPSVLSLLPPPQAAQSPCSAQGPSAVNQLPLWR